MRRPFSKAAARLRVIQGQDPPYPVSATRAGMFAMKWFLASLSVLFLTSLIACLLVTIQAGAWHSEAVPGLASRLWVSTIILLLVSIVLERGRQQIRLNRSQGLLIMLLLALVLCLAFLASQSRVWFTLEHIQLPEKAKALYAFSFGVLTGLHAIHVLGGFVPLTICIVRAFREGYSSYDHIGITYCAMYWHFLDAVWLVLVSAILLL